MLSRVLPLALLLGCVSGSSAQERALPAIFARPPAQAANRRVEVARGSSTSPRLAGLITEAILARAQVFEFTAPALPSAERSALVMERFIVRAEDVRPVEFPAPITPLGRFLRRGRLFEDATGKVRMTADLKLLVIEPVGALPKEITRVELRFNLRW